jgi:hypothetical protein
VEVLSSGVSLVLVTAPNFLLTGFQVGSKPADFISHLDGLLEYLLATRLPRSLVYNLLDVSVAIPIFGVGLAIHEPIEFVFNGLQFVNHQVLVSFDVGQFVVVGSVRLGHLF